MNLPYPYYIELCEFWSDPEAWFNNTLSDEELEDKKQSMQDALKQLRKD